MSKSIAPPKEGETRVVEKFVVVKTIGLSTFYFERARWEEKYRDGRWIATHFVEKRPPFWK